MSFLVDSSTTPILFHIHPKTEGYFPDSLLIPDLIDEAAIEHVQKIAERERAPMYTVGETTGDQRFAFEQADGVRPFDLAVDQMFG
ncbi:MAG: hypothetical protein II291_07215, partial [Succinivibrio sp.]|nr:hypothetical protein [Succinivibrio sp.]